MYKRKMHSLHLLEVAVEFGLNQDDAVEEFLHDLVLVGVVRLTDLLLLPLRLLINLRLDGLGVPCVLSRREPGQVRTGNWARGMRLRVAMGRTDCSNALNSCSLDFLYSSISFAASDRASLSLWTRSGTEVV